MQRMLGGASGRSWDTDGPPGIGRLALIYPLGPCPPPCPGAVGLEKPLAWRGRGSPQAGRGPGWHWERVGGCLGSPLLLGRWWLTEHRGPGLAPRECAKRGKTDASLLKKLVV